jgi:energy-coupling factor transport system permease protein
VAALRLFGGRLLALLVGAVRRGSRMALARAARGFGAAECRTSARTMRMASGDWLWIAGGTSLAVAAVTLSVALGTWRPLLG